MLLKEFSEAVGPSGFEDEIRSCIRATVEPHADSVYTDVLGNLICEKGLDLPGPRVLLDAHMDEVGLMIVGAEPTGLLRFRPLGSLDPRVLVAKAVRIGPNRLWGVIGARPIHLQAADERTKPIPLDQLTIDIGARSREDAETAVQPGDVAVFATEFGTLGDGCIKGKSFDNRLGCAVLAETLKQSPPLPVVGAFTVQEEIGCRGAQVVAHRVHPDIAIALESTVCFDVADAPSHGQGTVLGGGPALTVQDRRTLADARFLEFLTAVAEKHQIPYQMRRVKGGTNNFSAIHLARTGVVGGAISIPTRYIHAPTQVAAMADYECTIRLVTAVLQEIAAGGWNG